jgi:glucokinase
LAPNELAVGVDLGGTNLRAAVVDTSGGVVFAVHDQVGSDLSPEAVVARAARCVQRVLDGAAVELSEVAGVGIGIAAQLEGSSGVVAVSPNLGWRKVDFGRLMVEALRREVTVLNDLDAIVYAEVTHGVARGHRDVLAVYAGTGVGGGLVLAGRPYRGATGVPAEIGHVKVVGDGRECGCGQRGCLEAYLGGANLSDRLRKEALSDWSALLDRSRNDPGSIHPGLVESLATEGDERAGALWRELSNHFGRVLANAVTLLNPSALVLGGTVMEGCPTLKRLSIEVLKKQALAVAAERLKILDPALGGDAGVVGAAAYVLHEGRSVQ